MSGRKNLNFFSNLQAEHVKSFYPENYKMDLSETMKKTLLGTSIGATSLSTDKAQSNSSSSSGIGYVTEKLYMLLQLYLQNKGWNPSVELLQCFSELKDSLPSAAYLQVLANRLTLDSQGRLVLRENGKIVLPFEHFANAVMLKHMSGPHGLHLSVEATVRAVVESYTIGRENFGMEKDFIIEVVQSCPSPACRYYKNHMGIPPLPFLDQYTGVSPEFLQHLPQPPPTSAQMDLSKNHSNQQKLVPQMSSHLSLPPSPKPSSAAVQQQHQITQAILQQQQQQQQSQRVLEKQRALEKKHYVEVQNAVVAAAAGNSGIQVQDLSRMGMMQSSGKTGSSGNSNNSATTNNNSSHQSSPSPHLQPPPPPQTPTPTMVHIDNTTKSSAGDLLRSNLDSLESNKDLLALHNEAWGAIEPNRDGIIGQDKIVRAFSDLMRNMARMKTFIRPSMCKPYGKQSESLQKALMDTIQLVQNLRNCLPAPHIQVNSWKSENRTTETPDASNRVETLN